MPQLNYWQVTDSGRWRFVILSGVATGDPPGSNGQFQTHGPTVFPRYPWGREHENETFRRVAGRMATKNITRMYNIHV